MFSLLFPGQGSQIVGMGKEFYENFDYVKDLFQNADEIFTACIISNIGDQTTIPLNPLSFCLK